MGSRQRQPFLLSAVFSLPILKLHFQISALFDVFPPHHSRVERPPTPYAGMPTLGAVVGDARRSGGAAQIDRETRYGADEAR